MTRKVIVGSIIGAVILFAWSMISWMVLPYHNQANLKFTDEAAVVATISANAPTSGIYLLPNPQRIAQDLPEADKKAASDKSMAIMKLGPRAFVSITQTGMTSMTNNLLIEFANQWLAALLFCLMLLHLKPMNYLCRLFFTLLFGITVSVISEVPYWNWFHFSDCFVLVAMADKVISWFAAGAVMTLFVKSTVAK